MHSVKRMNKTLQIYYANYSTDWPLQTPSRLSPLATSEEILL